MMKKIKVVFKKKSDGRLSNVEISLDKKNLDCLGITKENPNVILIYQENILTIQAGISLEEKEEKRNGSVVYLCKNIKVSFSKAGKYISTKLAIPLSVVAAIGISNEEKEVEIKNLENVDKIEIIKSDSPVTFKEGKVGKIITVKVNKGGVGKTFTTVQLGSYLALLGKKVLLLTSDSQNNIIDYCFGIKKVFFDKGLKEFVKGGEGEKIKLRENLEFIPLENSAFGSHFLMNLPTFLDKMKNEYDYIIIDSIPTMKIDSVFVQCSDKIIIPCFADNVTIKGVINVVNEAGADKVLAILLNKYENKKVQNLLLEQITEVIKGTNILFPTPIKNISEIEDLLFKGKTIWESNSKKIEEIKKSIVFIGEALLEEKVVKKDEFSFDVEF